VRVRASSMSSLLVPKSKASVGQASTQAGISPFISLLSQQKKHFWIRGVGLWDSSIALSKGQENAHILHPIQFVSQVTGPCSIFFIALTRQAETQAGCGQSTHTFS